MDATPADEMRPVVAVVPAKDSEATVVETVRALLELRDGTAAAIDAVVVVDDGSTDSTTARVAAIASQRVHVERFARNRGKGAAMSAGIAARPDAATFVFIDADLGPTASIAGALLAPVLAGEADLTIGVPMIAAGSRGGLGTVKRLAARGIEQACGFGTTAPLSGQRALTGQLARSLDLAPRFGVETAMTIDAVRSGARVQEVPVAFEHRHTGRRIAGFAHRGRQGVDIVRALWPRLSTRRFRVAAVFALAGLFVLAAVLSSFGWEPSSVAIAGQGERKVVVFGMPRLSLNDLGQGDTPVLDRLGSKGAFAATSVRTLSSRPSTVEGYATLGAGARVKAGAQAGDAYTPSDAFGVRTAAEVARARTGRPVTGAVVVPALSATLLANQNRFVPSLPGALGSALRQGGKKTAVVANSDVGDVARDTTAGLSRPAAIALVDDAGSVDLGTVSSSLLEADVTAASGVRVDEAAFLAAAKVAMTAADVTVLDPGELDRVFAAKADTAEEQFETLRRAALRRSDEILGAVVEAMPAGTLLMVVSLRPPTGTWELTPTILYGDGVRTGYIHSPSTKRLGLITLTDLAPTIADAVGIDTPSTMIGHALRIHVTDGPASQGRLRDLNDLAGYRERIYLPLTKGYVVFQILVYLLAMLLFSARDGVGRAGHVFERVVLAIAAWPLATFVFRAIPHVWLLGAFGLVLALLIDAGLVWAARRFRSHPLAPLSAILFATLSLITVDLATGARLQQAAILGYSPHTAARFTGIGNAAFASLLVCTVLWAAIHVQYAPRREEALLSAGVVCAVVLIADGAPLLGADVGGILTMVPVFGLLLVTLTGRRLSVRALLSAGAATAALLAVAVGIDLLRPPDERSHLGQFVTASGDDSSTFATTIGRKLATNIRVFTGSFWTWIVPVVAITLLFFLVLQRGWERDLPPRSALRAGIVTALLAGLLGFAVNDSGTVVTALVFVELGPLITLLALARDENGPAAAPLTAPPPEVHR